MRTDWLAPRNVPQLREWQTTRERGGGGTRSIMGGRRGGGGGGGGSERMHRHLRAGWGPAVREATESENIKGEARRDTEKAMVMITFSAA